MISSELQNDQDRCVGAFIAVNPSTEHVENISIHAQSDIETEAVRKALSRISHPESRLCLRRLLKP